MKQDEIEYFYYSRMFILQGFSFEAFIECVTNGTILIDFDARTGHNHGTKFRMRQEGILRLYKSVVEF